MRNLRQKINNLNYGLFSISKKLLCINNQAQKTINNSHEIHTQNNKSSTNINNKNYKTRLYFWNSNVTPGVKKNDLKSRLSLSHEPRRISFFDDKLVKYVYCGIRHSGVLTEDGSLYMFGSNLYGNLGVGNNRDYSYYEPQLVKFFIEKDIKIKKFCCSDYNTIALSEDGDVYTWGYGGRSRRFLPLVKSK